MIMANFTECSNYTVKKYWNFYIWLQAITRLGAGRYDQDCNDLRVASLERFDREVYRDMMKTLIGKIILITCEFYDTAKKKLFSTTSDSDCWQTSVIDLIKLQITEFGTSISFVSCQINFTPLNCKFTTLEALLRVIFRIVKWNIWRSLLIGQNLQSKPIIWTPFKNEKL